MPTQGDTIGLLRDDQIDPCALLMALAFQDDPLFRYAWPDDIERARSLPSVFRWNVRHGFLFGLVLVPAGAVDGVAVAFPPDDAAVFAAQRLAQSGHDRVRETVRASAWDRLQSAFDRADEALQAAVQPPYWYLDVLAVDPARQGAGVGSALLRAVHARADATDVPTVLLTFQPRNVPLYERHGYSIVASGTEPASGLRWWGFRRSVGSAQPATRVGAGIG